MKSLLVLNKQLLVIESTPPVNDPSAGNIRPISGGKSLTELTLTNWDANSQTQFTLKSVGEMNSQGFI